MNEMCKHTRLARRGAVYYFRCKIPADLVQHLGKREIWESLRTRDATEALRRVRTRSEQQEQEFDRLRLGLQVTELTDAQIDAVAEGHYRDVLAWDEMQRQQGLTPAHLEAKRVGVDEGEHILREALADADLGHVSHLVEAQIITAGWSNVTQESRNRLAHALLVACSRANDALDQRLQGYVVLTPSAPSAASSQQSSSPRGSHGVTLEDLCAYWENQGDQKKSKTLHEARSVLKDLDRVALALPPSEIQKVHAIQLRDVLAAKNAPGTVKKKLGLLSAIFQVAMDDEMFAIGRNPLSGVKVRGTPGEKKPRAAFSIEQLQTIFASKVFSKGSRSPGLAGEAAYWLPVLGLFTGARLNELGQLSVDDVQRSEGIDFLRITDLGEGQSLKKRGKSRRRVPLHPELLRLGFLEYVEAVRKKGHQRLFAQLKPDSHGHLTGNWSKAFGRYLDNVVKIDDARFDFHSFRHTFKHFARASGIPEDQQDAITGHSNGSVGRTYGSAEGYPLAPLYQAIAQLSFAGLKLYSDPLV